MRKISAINHQPANTRSKIENEWCLYRCVLSLFRSLNYLQHDTKRTYYIGTTFVHHETMNRLRKFVLLLPLPLLAHVSIVLAFPFAVSSLALQYSSVSTGRVLSSKHGLPRAFPERLVYQPSLLQTFRSNSPFCNQSKPTTVLQNKSDDEDAQFLENGGELSALAACGILAQPVVWVSLYFVVTTGGGLPAGPFGLLGAVEGVSYLAVVGVVGLSIYKKITTGSGLPPGPNGLLGAVEGFSFLTLLVGLLSLAILVADQGCVPNAKPLLDYSAYLPVCDPEQTPGLFGGS
jgi:hypothetical protein